MGTTVPIRKVVDALELASDESCSFVNISSGEVRTLTHEELRLAEVDDAHDMPDWQRDAVNGAKEVLASADWVSLPDQFQIHEWEIMARFAQSLPSEAERAELNDSLRGRGAFRFFRATVRRLGLEEGWFAYKRSELEEIARSWLAEHDLKADG